MDLKNNVEELSEFSGGLKRSRLLSIVFCFVWLSLSFSSPAFSSTSGVSYQGRILKPDGSPLSGANTQFKMQIRTPDAGMCLMYEELQSLDLRNTGGAFSVTIGDGTGSRTDSTGLTLDKIFANHGSFTLDPTLCTSGTGVYSPNSSDGRNLVVLFKDETMATWEPIPAQKINFVPFAFEAKQIAGFTSQSLVRVAEADGTLDLVSPLSNANYTELLALINGTTTQYAKSNQLGGISLPTMSTGQVLGWNGSAWVSQDPSPIFTETASPPTATAGKDLLYADSTSHTLKLSQNGGAYSDVATVSSNITGTAANVTGTVAASHQAPPTIVAKAANYTITASDVANNTVFYADTSGGAFTLTLPSPTSLGSNLITIFDKTGSFNTNALTLAPHGSENIQGLNANLVLSANWGTYVFQTDGTDWYKISGPRNQTNKVYNTSGPWTAPAGITSVVVSGRGGGSGGGGGGGGGGGSGAAAAKGGGAGGGGSGTITQSRVINVVPGTTYVITIGAGGAGGTGGTGAVANVAGAAGGAGGVASPGNDTSFDALLKFKGAILASAPAVSNGGGGSLASAGGGGASGRGVLGLVCSGGGGGGGVNSAGSGGGAFSVVSPFGDIGALDGIGGAAGGASGGGGGGGSGYCAGADGAGASGAIGGAGGAAGSPGSNGANGTDGTQGNGGVGGAGGGGGGLLAGTGTAGGNGGNGGKGSDGTLTIQWSE